MQYSGQRKLEKEVLILHLAYLTTPSKGFDKELFLIICHTHGIAAIFVNHRQTMSFNVNFNFWFKFLMNFVYKHVMNINISDVCIEHF